MHISANVFSFSRLYLGSMPLINGAEFFVHYLCLLDNDDFRSLPPTKAGSLLSLVANPELDGGISNVGRVVA